jgi:hypothetical protein
LRPGEAGSAAAAVRRIIGLLTIFEVFQAFCVIVAGFVCYIFRSEMPVSKPLF